MCIKSIYQCAHTVTFTCGLPCKKKPKLLLAFTKCAACYDFYTVRWHLDRDCLGFENVYSVYDAPSLEKIN